MTAKTLWRGRTAAWCVFDPDGEPVMSSIRTKKGHAMLTMTPAKGGKEKHPLPEGHTVRPVWIEPREE